VGKKSAMNVNGFSAISSLQQKPIYIDMPHGMTSAAKTGFLLFIEQAPFKCKN
jgi:hypothetical protein